MRKRGRSIAPRTDGNAFRNDKKIRVNKKTKNRTDLI